MDRNIKLIYKEALSLYLPCSYNNTTGILNITLGRKLYQFIYGFSPLNQGGSFYIAKHKYGLNKLLQRSGFPVPKCIAFSKEKWAKQPLIELIKPLKFPLVAKPMTDTVRGLDVLCNIKDITALSDYLHQFFDKYNYVQIEEFHNNFKEYRVLVLKNSVIGVTERIAAFVIGDGKHSIEELIKIRNEERIRLKATLTISPLTVDLECLNCLEEQGLKLDSIVGEGDRIRLCYTVNTGRGGDICSMGKTIHPANAQILCKAAQATGLDLVGFDVLCEDINLPFQPQKWIIIEANPYPDSTCHELANHGVPQRVVNKILRQLIYRHPFSYLYHVCVHSKLSFYFKVGLVGLILILPHSYVQRLIRGIHQWW